MPGPTAFKLGLRGMPPEAESSLVERDIRLVTELRDARAHLHVAHTSTAAAVAAVRQARRNGLRVTCEVAPHHFLLTEEHVGLYNTNAKMNPPLRSAADRDAMIEAILDGVVDAIATDHAPHATHEKEVEFENAPNGITGLETALGLCLRWLHKEWKLPLGRVLSLLSAQPAALLGLKGRGTLAVGSFADVVDLRPQGRMDLPRQGDPLQSRTTRRSTAGPCKAKSAGRSAKAASHTANNRTSRMVLHRSHVLPIDSASYPRHCCCAVSELLFPALPWPVNHWPPPLLAGKVNEIRIFPQGQSKFIALLLLNSPRRSAPSDSDRPTSGGAFPIKVAASVRFRSVERIGFRRAH